MMDQPSVKDMYGWIPYSGDLFSAVTIRKESVILFG